MEEEGWEVKTPLQWLDEKGFSCADKWIWESDIAAIQRDAQTHLINALKVMQDAEPILRSEIREYKSALKEAKVALEGCIKFWNRDSESRFYDSIKDSKDALTTINKALGE